MGVLISNWWSVKSGAFRSGARLLPFFGGALTGVCWNTCFCGKEFLIGVLLLEPGIGGSTLDDAKAFAFLNVGFWVFRMWMGSVSSCSCDIVETVETTDSLFLWIGDNCVLGVNVPAAYRSSLLLSVPTRNKNAFYLQNVAVEIVVWLFFWTSSRLIEPNRSICYLIILPIWYWSGCGCVPFVLKR